MPDDPSTGHTEDCLHCPRCAKLMPVDRPHRGFGIAYRAWMGVVAICVMFTPIFIADMITILPLMACAALGGSTLARLANEPTRCKWCQLALEGPPRGFMGRRERLNGEYRRDAA